MIPPSYERKLLLMQSCVETDRSEMHTSRLSNGQNLQRPQKNHELHVIILMMSDSNSHWR